MITQATLAIFDLDNTLLAGDSDHAWGEFLIAQKLVDANTHQQQNDAFYNDYVSGALDITAYLQFALQFVAGKSTQQLEPLHNAFIEQMIAPMMLPKANALLKQHRDAGDYLLIITATNNFVTEPIAKLLQVDDILASNAEIVDGKYTGQPAGTPCFHQGKVERLTTWLANKSFDLADTYFYSDSHNDIPLLTAVGKPIAVDPDEKLRAHAAEQCWPVISLR